jgi:hypothetical protein
MPEIHGEIGGLRRRRIRSVGYRDREVISSPGSDQTRDAFVVAGCYAMGLKGRDDGAPVRRVSLVAVCRQSGPSPVRATAS